MGAWGNFHLCVFYTVKYERSLEPLEFCSKLRKSPGDVSCVDIENFCDSSRSKASCMRRNTQSPVWKCLTRAEMWYLVVLLQVRKIKLGRSLRQRTQTNDSLLIKVNSNARCKP